MSEKKNRKLVDRHLVDKNDPNYSKDKFIEMMESTHPELMQKWRKKKEVSDSLDSYLMENCRCPGAREGAEFVNNRTVKWEHVCCYRCVVEWAFEMSKRIKE